MTETATKPRASEVEFASKEIAQLVRDHVGEKYRESFAALLHSRLSTSIGYGASMNDILNAVHVLLHADHKPPAK